MRWCGGAGSAVGTLVRVYRRADAATLARTLLVIRDAYGDAGLESVVIDGLSLLCHRYNGELDDARLVARLSGAHGRGAPGLRRPVLRRRAPATGTVAGARYGRDPGGRVRRAPRGLPGHAVAVVCRAVVPAGAGRGVADHTTPPRAGGVELMKTSQYVQQEKAIAAADSGGIRQRWLYGLRLLRDPEAMASQKSLRHGVAALLIAAAQKRGLTLSEREIQRRLQCARAYPTEAQIRHAVSGFETWHDLVAAGFPPFEAPDGESPADHRTPEEVRHDRARRLADVTDPQGTLFPLSQFEPMTATLKDLKDYAEGQAALTARFAAHDAKRSAYLNGLIEAAGGDLDTTWQAAHEAWTRTGGHVGRRRWDAEDQL